MVDTNSKTREILLCWINNRQDDVRASNDWGCSAEEFRKLRLEASGNLGQKSLPISPVEVPSGMRLSRTCVQYDDKGNIVQEWRRISTELEANEVVTATLERLHKLGPPKFQDIKFPKDVDEDLMVEVPLFDSHFGKYAWAEETDTDYDLDIAKKLMLGTVTKLMSQAGYCGKGLLVIGGDFFHSDTRHNMTERGNNPLDVDTRQAKVWRCATEAIYESVVIMAAHCKQVEIIVIPGNHDWESSFSLQRQLKAFYCPDERRLTGETVKAVRGVKLAPKAEPRVIVRDSPKSRAYVQWGTVLLGLAHGHLVKMSDYPHLMAQECPKEWANTTERLWHLGHIHRTKTLKTMSTETFVGVVVEHLETFAGTDAWHHEKGFVGSPMRTCGFVWHKEHGLRSRLYVTCKEVLDG